MQYTIHNTIYHENGDKILRIDIHKDGHTTQVFELILRDENDPVRKGIIPKIIISGENLKLEAVD